MQVKIPQILTQSKSANLPVVKINAVGKILNSKVNPKKIPPKTLR